MQDKDSSLFCTKFEAFIKFDWSFLRTKWHHLLGETVGDSCSTGPGNKQCTRAGGVERVKILTTHRVFQGKLCIDN